MWDYKSKLWRDGVDVMDNKIYFLGYMLLPSGEGSSLVVATVGGYKLKFSSGLKYFAFYKLKFNKALGIEIFLALL